MIIKEFKLYQCSQCDFMSSSKKAIEECNHEHGGLVDMETQGLNEFAGHDRQRDPLIIIDEEDDEDLIVIDEPLIEDEEDDDDIILISPDDDNDEFIDLDDKGHEDCDICEDARVTHDPLTGYLLPEPPKKKWWWQR